MTQQEAQSLAVALRVIYTWARCGALDPAKVIALIDSRMPVLQAKEQ